MSLLADTHKPKLQTTPAFPLPDDKRKQHYPENPQIKHLLLMMRFRPIFGLPFLVTKCRLLNQDLKTHASNRKHVCQTEGRFCFVTWPDAIHPSFLENSIVRPSESGVPPLFNPTICTQPLVKMVQLFSNPASEK